MPPNWAIMLIYGLSIAAAAFVLRDRLVFVFRASSPTNALYILPWTWRRTIVLVPLFGALLWLVPLVYGILFSSVSLRPVALEIVLQAVAIQIVLVGFAEEVFFREAALAEWVERPFVGLAISLLAFFIFHLHQGLPQATIALGTGIVYCALRVAGAGILAVASLHGITNVLFSRVISVGLTMDTLSAYSVFFLCGSVCIMGAIYIVRQKFLRQPGRM